MSLALEPDTRSAIERPLWMRRMDRRADRFLPLALLFGLLPALAILLAPGLPYGGSLERYAFRSDNYARAFAEGRLYPRWAPNAQLGYGAPIFNYTPPLPGAVPAALHVLLTGDSAAAIRLTSALAVIMCSLLTYLWARRRFGPIPALFTCALLMTSPYVSQDVLYRLGDFTMTLMLALLPAWLWCADRLGERRGWSFILMVALTAALILTWPPALAAAVLVVALTSPFNRRTAGTLGMAIILGIGASACYWLPALVEAPLATWTAGTAPARLSLGTLLRLPSVFDADLLNPQPILSLGLPLSLAVCAALLSLAWLRDARPRLVGLLAAGLAALLISAGLQADARVLFPITLALAASTSGLLVLAVLRHARRPAWALTGLTMALFVLSVTAWLFPLPHTLPGSFGPAAEVDFERRGFGVAVLADSDAFPSALQAPPGPDQTLLNSYASGSVVKIGQTEGSEAVTAGVLSHGTQADRLQVYATAPVTLQILTAAFPGWTAAVNDMPAPISAGPDGLLRVAVPAGSYEVTIRFDETDARLAAWLITWTAVIIAVIVSLRRAVVTEQPEVTPPEELQRPLMVVTGACCAIAIVLQVLVVSGRITLPAADALPSGLSEIGARTADGLELIGLEPLPDTLSPGSTLDVVLYWRTLRALPTNDQVRLRLVNRDSNETLVETELRHPGGIPSGRWIARGIVRDQTQLALPADVPSGEYALVLETVPCSTQCSASSPVTFFGSDGVSYGPSLEVAAFPDAGRISPP